jgi:ligand-binding sensor domain-containing protein
MNLKDSIIQQIESGAQGEIWDTQGEGRVRYAGAGKKFGNVKLVPRKRWTPT